MFTDRDLAMLLQSDEDGVFDMTVRREVDGKAQKVNLEGVTFQIVTQEDGTRLRNTISMSRESPGPSVPPSRSPPKWSVRSR